MLSGTLRAEALLKKLCLCVILFRGTSLDFKYRRITSESSARIWMWLPMQRFSVCQRPGRLHMTQLFVPQVCVAMFFCLAVELVSTRIGIADSLDLIGKFG